MPQSYAQSATLKLLRSREQSGSKAMPDAAGTWLTCYEQSYPSPWLFAGAEIDLTSMQAGDTTEIEVAKKVEPGGSYVVEAANPYSDAQTDPLKHIDEVANVYGIRVRMRMTAGVARTFYCEFFEAVRR